MIPKKMLGHIILADGVKSAVEAYKNIGETVAGHAAAEETRRKEAHDSLRARKKLFRSTGERERR